ncbi:hypothetical protein ORM77_25385 [Bacillus cereus]|uniref:GapS4b family protein n=1 Tax=Bacillus cereus TaxID=1396 RepID=UPI002AC0CFC2|nr:hypothetical protein [Bacillus cereus]MDZ4621183.1 hypothetical protein [Bacillus cereus]
MKTQNNTNPLDIETILPFGDTLRPLLLSSCLSKHDLKRILAKRGIFISDTDSEFTIPILQTILFSPKEFEDLKERQKTKEDNVKRNTQAINWKENISLSDAIDTVDFDIHEIISSDCANYEVMGVPEFIVEDRNCDEIILRYKIERTDLTKNWIEHSTFHDGAIIFTKNNDNEIKIIMEHTCAETKEINEKIKRTLIRNFKEQEFIEKDTVIDKITASRFSTLEKRNEFLMRLLGNDKINSLTFKEVTNIEIGPDASKKSLPAKIRWMKDHVKNLILKGNSLHNMDLLKDELCRKALIIEDIEAVYDFEFRNVKGTCKIVFGFPKLLKTKDGSIEFQFQISSISILKTTDYSKKEIEKHIFSTFDKLKDKLKDELLDK